MTTDRRGFKSDRAAQEAFGSIYDAVPKSAFALIAYHLADLCAEHPGDFASIMARIQDEADALAANEIMPARHAKVIADAVRKEVAA